MSFSADEVFEMAEQIERNGQAFYQKACSLASGPVKPLFQRLSEMEKDHVRVFHEMRTVPTPEDKLPSTLDPDNLAIQYLRSLTEGVIFDLQSDDAMKVAGRGDIREKVT